MKIVIFGLTVSSSWGNGHATLWRGLIHSLAAMGHRVVFFERDVAYYADTRDLFELPGGTLCLYGDWADVRSRAARELADADARHRHVASARMASTRRSLSSMRREPLAVFYDLDTPVTLSLLATGAEVVAIGPSGLRRFRPRAELYRRRGAGCPEKQPWRVPCRAALRPCRSRHPQALPPGAAIRLRPVLYRHLFGGPAARRRGIFRGARPAQSARRFVLAGAQYPAGFPLDREHPLRPASAAGGASGLLRLVAAHAQCHAACHGRDGLVPVRQALRGDRLRGRGSVAIGGKGWTHSSSPGGRSWSRATPRMCSTPSRGHPRLRRIGLRPASGPWRNTHRRHARAESRSACSRARQRRTAPWPALNWRPEHVGNCARRRAGQPHSAARLLEGAAARSAAASTARPSGPAP